jgi:hypothetical protein
VKAARLLSSAAEVGPEPADLELPPVEPLSQPLVQRRAQQRAQGKGGEVKQRGDQASSPAARSLNTRLMLNSPSAQGTRSKKPSKLAGQTKRIAAEYVKTKL